MTTPSLNSAYRVVTLAMENAALLAQGQIPNSQQLSRYLGRLNDVIHFEQTQGLKLWLQVDTAITPVQGQQSYTIMSGGDVNLDKPLRVLDDGYFLDSNNLSRQLFMISRDEYYKLSTRFQEGTVNQYYVEKLVDRLKVYLWLVPDAEAATGTVHINVAQQVGTLTSLTETMNFPQEWTIGLGWLLAAEICTGQPERIIARCTQMAGYYREALNNWDVEDTSVYLQMDSRGAR